MDGLYLVDTHVHAVLSTGVIFLLRFFIVHLKIRTLSCGILQRTWTRVSLHSDCCWRTAKETYSRRQHILIKHEKSSNTQPCVSTCLSDGRECTKKWTKLTFLPHLLYLPCTQREDA